jgi:hypothetical protein
VQCCDLAVEKKPVKILLAFEYRRLAIGDWRLANRGHTLYNLFRKEKISKNLINPNNQRSNTGD